MNEIQEIENIIQILSSIKGISKGQAIKIANNIAEMSIEKFTDFQKEMFLNKSKIKNCSLCSLFSNKEICSRCSSNDNSTLLIVESRNEIKKILDLEIYSGKFFVVPFLYSNKLTKLFSFDFSFLKEYIKKFDEIIIGISQIPEGILTVNELLNNLSHPNITQLAIGMPIGIPIEYVDKLSLNIALKDRKVVK
ncbi:MAG: hypothetical protein ACRCRZ_01690 [Metamycoplasmataceae bacterium]